MTEIIVIGIFNVLAVITGFALSIIFKRPIKIPTLTTHEKTDTSLDVIESPTLNETSKPTNIPEEIKTRYSEPINALNDEYKHNGIVVLGDDLKTRHNQFVDIEIEISVNQPDLGAGPLANPLTSSLIISGAMAQPYDFSEQTQTTITAANVHNWHNLLLDNHILKYQTLPRQLTGTFHIPLQPKYLPTFSNGSMGTGTRIIGLRVTRTWQNNQARLYPIQLIVEHSMGGAVNYYNFETISSSGVITSRILLGKLKTQ